MFFNVSLNDKATMYPYVKNSRSGEGSTDGTFDLDSFDRQTTPADHPARGKQEGRWDDLTPM